MAVAFDAVSNVAAGTGTLSWTHTPTGTPRGVKVDIVENGGTNGISSVTYGGVAMELVAVNAKSSGEAGTVVTYFLGKNIPTGAQTVSVTVSDAVSKRAVATTVTASSDTCWASVDFSISSDSIANPSSTLSLLSKTCFVSLVGHSGQNAVTGTTQLTGWTSRLEHDFGNQCGSWYTYNTVSTADVSCGWTQTADDAVMVALAITEAPMSVDSTSVGVTESASIAVVFDSRALPINILESASVTILTSVSATDSVAAQANEGSAAIGLVVSATDSMAVQIAESSSKSSLDSQQALPIYLTDTATVTQIGIFVIDSVAIQASDVSTLQSSIPFFSVQDIQAVTVGDARPTVATETGAIVLQAVDSLSVAATDAVTNVFVFVPGQTQNFVVSDSLKVQLNGSGAIPIGVTASDSIGVTIDEPATQDGAFGVIDSLRFTLTESSSVNTGSAVAFFSASDTVAVQASELSSLVNNTILTVSDSAKVQVPEDIPDVATVIATADSISAVASEPSDQSTQFGVVDTVAIQAGTEASQISGLLTFAVADSIQVGLSELTSFGQTSVKAVDSCQVIASEVLTNSATVSAIDSLRTDLSEAVLLFKGIPVSDISAVQLSDSASPIFNSFVGISASDTLAIQASETVSQLVSFLTQITTSDSIAPQFTEDVTSQSLSIGAQDQVVIQAGELLDIFTSPSVTDSITIGTTEIGISIPIVPVGVTSFTDDTISGFQDDAIVEAQNPSAEDVAISLLESVSTAKAFPAIDSNACRTTEQAVLFASLSVTDSVVQALDDSLAVAAVYQASDSCGVTASGHTSGYTVVANATPNTWDGNIATERRNNKPKPWKYIFSDKLNW